MEPARLQRYAWLSIAAALTTMGLKAGAWLLTGSVGLLSDAMESMVNLVAALVALWALTIAARPADEDHEFGHGKAEYVSSGVEGALILVAALAIGYTAVRRLITPAPVESVGLGLAISVLASLINLAVALVMLRGGKRHGSIVLEADGHHLLTDVWTSAGVVVGLGLVWVTGWRWLDPVVALAVAANIVRVGVVLLYRSGNGLLDVAVSAKDRAALEEILNRYRHDGANWHALKTRQAGMRRFITVHVLVPGAWTIERGHDLCERLEAEMRATHPRTTVFTHLEPLEDPRAHGDQGLDRPDVDVAPATDAAGDANLSG